MDTLNEQSILVSELKQICGRLGEAVAGMNSDLCGSRDKIDGIDADLDRLRATIAGPPPGT
jgi:hypothetical protein